MSGRGVRFKFLSPKEKRTSDAFAMRNLATDATTAEYFDARLYEGAKSFLVEVTEQHGLPTLFPAEGGIVPSWRRVNYTELSSPESELNFDTGGLFTPADVEALQGLYRMYHEPSAATVQKLMGEAKPVA